MKTMELKGFEPLSQEESVAVTGGAIMVGSSLTSGSNVALSQTLTWDSVLADLVGSAVGEGVNNAHANVDLGQTSVEGGIALT